MSFALESVEMLILNFFQASSAFRFWTNNLSHFLCVWLFQALQLRK